MGICNENLPRGWGISLSLIPWSAPPLPRRGGGGGGGVGHTIHRCIRICYSQHGLHQRLEQPPRVKFFARLSSRVPFLYLIKKTQNLAFRSGRLTSSSDLASYALSHSSSVQKSFFYGDVITITSRAPNVVNLVRPYSISAFLLLLKFTDSHPARWMAIARAMSAKFKAFHFSSIKSYSVVPYSTLYQLPIHLKHTAATYLD